MFKGIYSFYTTEFEFDPNLTKYIVYHIGNEFYRKPLYCVITGGFVDGQGSGASGSIVVMVTNLCPNISPNLSWCNQEGGSGNQYGYHVHFDLENGGGQLGNVGWTNNPEVTYEQTSCSGSNTPSSGDYGECQC